MLIQGTCTAKVYRRDCQGWYRNSEEDPPAWLGYYGSQRHTLQFPDTYDYWKTLSGLQGPSDDRPRDYRPEEPQVEQGPAGKEAAPAQV